MPSGAVRSGMPAVQPPTVPPSTLWMIAPTRSTFLKTVSHDQLRRNGKGDFLRTIKSKKKNKNLGELSDIDSSDIQSL